MGERYKEFSSWGKAMAFYRKLRCSYKRIHTGGSGWIVTWAYD